MVQLRRGVALLGWGALLLVGVANAAQGSAEEKNAAARRLLQIPGVPQYQKASPPPESHPPPRDHPLLDLVPPGMIMTAPAIPPMGPRAPAFDVAPFVTAPPMAPRAPEHPNLGDVMHLTGLSKVDDLLASSESNETSVDSDSNQLLENTKFSDPLDLLSKKESPPPFPSDPIIIRPDGSGGFMAAEGEGETVTAQSVDMKVTAQDDAFDDPLGLFNDRPPPPAMPLVPGTLVPPAPPDAAYTPSPPFIVEDDPLGLLASMKGDAKPRHWDERSLPRALILSGMAITALLALVVASARAKRKAAAAYQLGPRAAETATYGTMVSASTEEQAQLLSVDPAHAALGRL